MKGQPQGPGSTWLICPFKFQLSSSQPSSRLRPALGKPRRLWAVGGRSSWAYMLFPALCTPTRPTHAGRRSHSQRETSLSRNRPPRITGLHHGMVWQQLCNPAAPWHAWEPCPASLLCPCILGTQQNHALCNLLCLTCAHRGRSSTARTVCTSPHRVRHAG